MLKTIYEVRKRKLGHQHVASGEAAYALGILHHITENDADAKRYYTMAHSVYAQQVGPNSEPAQAILAAIADLAPAGSGSKIGPAGATAGQAQGLGASVSSSHSMGTPRATPTVARNPPPEFSIPSNAPNSVSSTVSHASTTSTAGGKASSAASSSSSQVLQPTEAKGGDQLGIYAVPEGGVSANAERRGSMGKPGTSIFLNRDGSSIAAPAAAKEGDSASSSSTSTTASKSSGNPESKHAAVDDHHDELDDSAAVDAENETHREGGTEAKHHHNHNHNHEHGEEEESAHAVEEKIIQHASALLSEDKIRVLDSVFRASADPRYDKTQQTIIVTM